MSIRPTDEILEEPFWRHLAQGHLAIQQCSRCKTFQHPPGEICHKCTSFALDWTAVSGRARLYSFTVARHAVHASLDAEVPYVIALVELDEGVRIVSTVVGVAAADLRIGMRLACTVKPVSEGFALPLFTPAPEDA